MVSVGQRYGVLKIIYFLTYRAFLVLANVDTPNLV